MSAELGLELEVGRLAGEWRELADRTGAVPFAYPGWIDLWWQAFGRGRLELLTLRSAGRLIAVLPTTRRAGEVASTTNFHTPVFEPVVESEEAARDLARSLFASSHSSVRLASLAEHRPGVAAFAQTAEATHHRLHLTGTHRAPYVSVDGDWAGYVRSLSTNRRRGIHRRERRLAEAGTVTVDFEDGRQRLGRLLDEGFHVEGSGWKTAGGTAIESSATTRRFYTDVAHWAARNRSLRLSFLRLEGRAIAFDYSLVKDGVWYSLKAGYDPAYRQYSPGSMLLYRMLELVFAERLRSLELLGMDEPYKREWTHDFRTLIDLEAHPLSARGLARRVGVAVARPAVRQARRLVRR